MKREEINLSELTKEERKLYKDSFAAGYGVGYANGYDISYSDGVMEERLRFSNLLVALKDRLVAKGNEELLFRAIADPDLAYSLAKEYFPDGVPGEKSAMRQLWR